MLVPGDWRIMVGLVVLAAAPAHAQQAEAAAEEPDIVVTGSRTQPGAVFGDIKPELQLGPADIRSFGVASIADLLTELAPQTRSNRGGAPVVLVNGRRVSGFGEIRDIPVEAIARVDILPAEVGLKYGFSADSRVVNFVLRQRFRGTTLEAKGGGATEGGGATRTGQADYLRIQKQGRLNVHAEYAHTDGLSEADRGIVTAPPRGPPRGPVAPSGAVPDVAAFRSLNRATDTTALNAVYNRVLPAGLSATANARFQFDNTSGSNGIATTILAVPPGPFGAPDAASPVLRYVPEIGALHADTQTTQLHVGTTLNADGPRWHWSLLGNFDRTDSRSRTQTGADATAFQALVTAGGNPLAPFAGLILPRPRDTASSVAQGGSVDGLVSGRLIKLPAGDANVALKLLGSTNAFDATVRGGVVGTTHFNRNLISGQANFDMPVTSRKTGFGAVIGDLTVNGNFAAQRLSDFGTLTTVGYGLNWAPVSPLTVIASHTTDHVAPSAQQLQGPLVVTPNVAIFDPATGTTALVTVTSGGTTSLGASTRRVTKVELNLKPLKKPDLTFTANYVRTRLDNAIAAFPATSAAIEAAFPERFRRDASGALVSLDARPVNFAREATDTLRLGADLSIPLSTQVNPAAAGRGGDARVGGPGSGEDGRGGGRGGGRGFGGGGGRLQFALYDTIYFRDDVLIRPGVPLLDLLNGGALGTNGGQPRHEVEGQAGVSKNGIGARLSANWRPGTRIDGSVNPNGALTFAPLATANLRLFANFGQMPGLVRDHPWLRGARLTCSLTNLTNARERVRDIAGATPLAYQPAYLDPVGRAVGLSFRKLFFTPPQRRGAG